MKTLYKTTTVIWSEFDPLDGRFSDDALSLLSSEAEQGSAYCSKMQTTRVEDPQADPDWDGTEFFISEEEPQE